MDGHDYEFFMDKQIYVNNKIILIRNVITNLEKFIKDKDINGFNLYYNCIIKESRILIKELIENGHLNDEDKKYFSINIGYFVKS